MKHGGVAGGEELFRDFVPPPPWPPSSFGLLEVDVEGAVKAWRSDRRGRRWAAR